MSKEYIVNHWEQDWDYEHIYYNVGDDGLFVKFDVETGNIIVSVSL